MIINQIKQKLHLVGYLPVRYYKDARYHEHKIHINYYRPLEKAKDIFAFGARQASGQAA